MATSGVAALVTSLAGCGIMIWAGPRDQPTEARKAHKIPTPTSGGLGVALGIAAGLLIILWEESPWSGSIGAAGARDLLMLFGLSAMILLLGFMDDVLGLSAPLKFLVIAAFSIAGALSFGVVRVLPFSAGDELALPFALGLFGTALWIFTLINCVNFMDGANGLAMGAMMMGFLALGAVALAHGEPAVLAACICCTGALGGFLVWNFPGGRLFAGDAGSLFAGAAAALSSLILITRTGLSPAVPPIVFFPLLADVLLTLLWRSRRGRRLLAPHAEHLYQVALRVWPGHVRVTLIYWAAMAACGATAFMVARESDPSAGWIALAFLAAVSVLISGSARSWAAARGDIAP